MKTICILFASCTIISLPAYSWDYTGNYENIRSEDEDIVHQTPAIIETVKVGGFTLDMDRMETGFYIPNPFFVIQFLYALAEEGLLLS